MELIDKIFGRDKLVKDIKFKEYEYTRSFKELSKESKEMAERIMNEVNCKMRFYSYK